MNVTMIGQRYHIVFNLSAAHALGGALAGGSRPDQILCLSDDFSFGPIGRTVRERANWIERELRLEGWQGVVDDSKRFLTAYRSVDTPVTAWTSRHDANTFAGFLWWLARAGTAPVMIADGDALRDRVNVEILTATDHAKPLSVQTRVRHQDRWKRLEQEDAPLRVIRGDELVSMPLDYFDANLLGHATDAWQRMARIVGKMFDDFERWGRHQTSDAVLAARLVALVHQGRLEARGSLDNMAICEVRKPVE